MFLTIFLSVITYAQGAELSVHQDSLISKYGGMMEYNSTPDEFEISQIIFRAGPCFGTCPIFTLTITNDRKVIYKAENYNKNEGTFETFLDSETYDTLIMIINYIKLTELKDVYTLPHTDDRTYRLEIIYNYEKMKTISDYGAKGTFGLKNLYNHFFNIRNNTEWKRKSD
ncbi:hypothetical protein BH10BAC5_BH10BAC5_12030 [soil metagenome]